MKKIFHSSLGYAAPLDTQETQDTFSLLLLFSHHTATDTAVQRSHKIINGTQGSAHNPQKYI